MSSITSCRSAVTMVASSSLSRSGCRRLRADARNRGRPRRASACRAPSWRRRRRGSEAPRQHPDHSFCTRSTSSYWRIMARNPSRRGCEPFAGHCGLYERHRLAEIADRPSHHAQRARRTGSVTDRGRVGRCRRWTMALSASCSRARAATALRSSRPRRDRWLGRPGRGSAGCGRK